MTPESCRALRLRLVEGAAGLERETHLASCPACREALADAARIHAALALLSEEDPPPALRIRVMKAFRSRPRRIPPVLWWIGASAAAGFLVVALRSRPAPPQLPSAEAPETVGIPPPQHPPAPVETPKPPVAIPPVPTPLPQPEEKPVPAPTPLLAEEPNPPQETQAPPAPEPERPPERGETTSPDAPPPSRLGNLLAAYAGSDLASLRLEEPIQGPPASLSSLAGNVVLVSFWGAG